MNNLRLFLWPQLPHGSPFVGKGRIKPGSKVLVHAAAGGLGIFAIQIAKSFGAYAPPRQAPVIMSCCARSELTK